MFGEKAPPQADQKGYIFVNGKYIKKSSTTIDDKAVVVGAGKVATDGGWSEELTCGTSGSLCGAQGRLHNVKGASDNMGVTDFASSVAPSKWIALFHARMPRQRLAWPARQRCRQCRQGDLLLRVTDVVLERRLRHTANRQLLRIRMNADLITCLMGMVV